MIVLLAHLFFLNLTWAANYSLADLKVLETQNAYEEFLKHARDIRPSERSSEWHSMLSHMIQIKLQEMLKKRQLGLNHLTEVEALSNWPEVKEDEVVQLYRGEYVLEYLRQCFKDSKGKESGSCHGQVLRLWEGTHLKRKSARFGAIFHKIIDEHAPQLARFDYLTYALISVDNGDHFCSQDHVRRGVFKHYQKEISQNSADLKKLKVAIDNDLSPVCWQKFSQFLKSSYFSFSPIQKEISYWLLTSKESLTIEEEDFFLSLYLLQGPVVGEIFNLSWNRVKLLGENFPRRQKVIAQLLQLDPLPDQLFSSNDKARAEVLARFVLQNLPEYIKSYLEFCLSYYKGSKTFVNGNPTLRCQDLLATAKTYNLKPLFPAYQQFESLEQTMNSYLNKR